MTDKVLITIDGCATCPWATPAQTCGLHPQKISIAQHVRFAADLLQQTVRVAPYASACPLIGSRTAVQLQGALPTAGRPLKFPTSTGRNLTSEAKHFLRWLGKQPGRRLSAPVSDFLKKDQSLKDAHFRAALSGRRPFYEFELDKVVTYAMEKMGYTPEALKSYES